MEEENPSQSLNTIVIYILSGLVIVLLAFIGYSYKDNSSNNTAISSFERLDLNIQEQYVKKEELLELEKSLEDANARVQNLKNKLHTSQKNDKIYSKAQPQDSSSLKATEIQKELIEKTVIVKEDIDRSNYKTYTCKSFEAGGISIPLECKEQLISFLESNKDAKLFEIIGLVDDTEFKLIQKLEDVYGEKKIKDIKKYVQRGLSRQRVIEMTWLIKEHFNNKVELNAVNYTLYSKDKRGFVVKAYY